VNNYERGKQKNPKNASETGKLPNRSLKQQEKRTMDPTTLVLELFGVGSLAFAFAKYTIEKRKMASAEDNMKNNYLTHSLGCNNSPIS
jgi:hypothetical protein